MTTEQSTTGLAPASRKRKSSAIEARLEQQLGEIHAELAQRASKEDLEQLRQQVTEHIDRRTADILEAIGCQAGSSSTK